jgi:hypothetical protein
VCKGDSSRNKHDRRTATGPGGGKKVSETKATVNIISANKYLSMIEKQCQKKIACLGGDVKGKNAAISKESRVLASAKVLSQLENVAR